MPTSIRRLLCAAPSLLGGFFLFLFAAQPIQAQNVTSFEFNPFTSGTAKMAGVPFQVGITARDQNGDVAVNFASSITLSDETGTIYPTQTGNFTNGVWNGMVYITQASVNNVISASFNSIAGASQTFSVGPDSRMAFIGALAGNNQSGLVGTQLSTPFTAKITDPYGNPIPNVGVNFIIASAPTGATNQALSNSGATSGANGEVATTLTLGRKNGTYMVSATLTSGFRHSTQFFATANPGNLISLGISPYITVIPAGGTLPFSAKGYDLYFNEISNPPVLWSIQNGGGTIDSTGIFKAGFVLGNFSNTVKAISGQVGATASVSVVDVFQGSTEPSGPGAGLGTGIAATASATPIPDSGVLYNVQVEPSVLALLRNARIPIVAQGVDFFGNPVSGVTYNFETTGSLGTIAQTGPGSALLTGTDGGLGTVVVTATQGDITQIARIAGSVGAGMNRRLVIEDIESPQQVGQPFTISIAAKDALNNFVTDYEGPLVLADSTGTLDPSVIQPSPEGIWYVQGIISIAHPEVSITVAGDGMVGVSNIFEVTGDPKLSELGLGKGFGGGLSDVLGATISAKINELMDASDLSRFGIIRYIGAGLAAGFGILGASVGGGLMASRGLEAIGRNPFAKARLQTNLYIGLVVFIAAASLAVFASTIIMR